MNKTTPTQREKDIVTNRILIIFTLALVCIFLVIPLQKYLGKPISYVNGLLLIKILCGVGIAGVIGGISLTVIRHKKGIPSSQKLLRGTDICILFGALTISMLLTLFYYNNFAHLLYVIIPLLAILGIIYYVYQRELFILSVYAEGSAMAIFILGKMSGNGTGPFDYIALILFAVVTIAFIVISAMLRARGGAFGRIRIFSKKAIYLGLYFFPPVALAAAIATLINPSLVLYLLLGLMTYFLVFIIIYTLRLI